MGTPANTMAALQDCDADVPIAPFQKAPRSRQPSKSGTDDHNVLLDSVVRVLHGCLVAGSQDERPHCLCCCRHALTPLFDPRVTSLTSLIAAIIPPKGKGVSQLYNKERSEKLQRV